jgi:hypothetical protein
MEGDPRRGVELAQSIDFLCMRWQRQSFLFIAAEVSSHINDIYLRDTAFLSHTLSPGCQESRTVISEKTGIFPRSAPW